jgi:hypothetical protein
MRRVPVGHSAQSRRYGAPAPRSSRGDGRRYGQAGCDVWEPFLHLMRKPISMSKTGTNRWLLPIGAALAVVVAGCASSGRQLGGSSTPSSSTTITAAQTGAGGSVSTPVLGRRVPGTFTGSFSDTGIGQVKPSLVDTGGTADSTVSKIVWSSWGDKEALGTGWWQPGGQQGGTANVVAFDLGMCQGIFMYRSLEWYFTQSEVDPGYGHSFDPNRHLDICTDTAEGAPG